MKSLEHLIREIQEGKAEKSEKKTLEGSIRNVMSKESSYAAKDSKPVDEHCGCEDEKKKKISKEDGDKLPGSEDKMDEAIGTLGTDKYQGTEFKSIRTATPHIQPPKGDETHSQAPENASRLRNIAKEKGGINRVSEESGLQELVKTKGFGIDTLLNLVPAGRALTVAKRVLEPTTLGAENEFARQAAQGLKAPPKTPELPAPTPTKVAPEAKPPAVVPAKPSTVPAKVPETTPAKVPELPTQVPAKAPVKTPELPAEIPAKAPVKAPEAPKVDTATLTKTATATKPAEEVKTKSKEQPAKAPSAPPPPPPQDKKGEKPSRKRDISLGLGGMADATQYVGKPHIQAPWKIHGTKPHRVHESSGTDVRKKIYDMPIGGERKETSYVGRPNDDVKGTSEKLSRQAQYKIKIIDESKKLAGIVKEAIKEKKEILDKPTKVFDYGKGDLVVINPDPKKNTLDVKDQ
jgi:hypothetical protein